MGLAISGAVICLILITLRWGSDRRSKLEMQALSVASARASLIQSWMNERVADSEVLAIDLSRQAGKKSSSASIDSMKSQIQLIQKVYKYDGIYLIDEDGNPVISSVLSPGLNQFAIPKEDILATPPNGMHSWLQSATDANGNSSLMANVSIKISRNIHSRNIYLIMRMYCPIEAWAGDAISSDLRLQEQFSFALKQSKDSMVFLGPPEENAKFQKEVKLEGVDWSLVVGVRTKYWKDLIVQDLVTYFGFLTLFLFVMGLIIREIIRRRAADELAASENRLRISQSIARIGTWELDVQTQIVICSEQLFQLFGRESTDSACTFKDLVDQVDVIERATVIEALESLIASGGSSREIVPIRFPVRLLSGERRYMEMRAQCSKNFHTGRTTIIGTFLDLTEREQFESRIQAEKDLAQKYLDIVGVMLVVVGASQNVSLINRRGLEILKAKSANEILGKNWFDHFIGKEHRDGIKEVFNRLIEGHETADWHEMENEIITLDGERRLISWRNTMLRDSTGKVTGILSSGEDITEKQRINDEIKETQARLLKAQELAHIGAWTRSFATDEVIWSPQVFKIFGRRPGEFDVTLERLVSLVHEDDRERVQKVIMESEKNGTDFSLDYRILLPDGTIRWVNSTCQHDRDSLGKPYRLFGIIQDITERKELEEGLRAATERARTATQAKSEFLANISHEVRTPLNAVIGLSYLLTKTELTLEQRTYLEKISFSAKLLLGIISDVLDFSRIEARKLELVEEEFDVSELEGALLSLLAEQAKRKGLRFVFEQMPNVPSTLLGDRLRLIQVLINLCSNAIKFTDKGEVRVRVESLGLMPDGKHQLKFSVRDTGIGIAQEHLGMLFQSFSQIEGATRRKFGGTGLGLVISKQIAEIMGGSISVESIYGEGSCFSFTVPLMAILKERRFLMEVRSITGKSSTDRMSHSNYRILLVEDNEINQMVVKDILESNGFQVFVAESGVRAIHLVEQASNPFDLILMDIQMPEMDGYEATRRIRKHLNELSIKQVSIIALTAYALSEDKDKYNEAGMSDYLTKPIDPVKLLKVISKYLSIDDGDSVNDELMTLNVDQALLRLGQKQALYVKLLKMFKESYALSAEAIEDLVKQGNLKACHDFIHSMRGASENISAERLSKVLGDMEELTLGESLQQVDLSLREISKALPVFRIRLQELLLEIDLAIKKF